MCRSERQDASRYFIAGSPSIITKVHNPEWVNKQAGSNKLGSTIFTNWNNKEEETNWKSQEGFTTKQLKCRVKIDQLIKG